MRPVSKGLSPLPTNYSDYTAAKPDLISRLGSYCSYCERHIATNLAVEHIQPKDGPNGHPALIGTWTNFLLACVNCNSAKGSKNVVLSDLLFPDRDNTFACYTYTKDGKVQVKAGLGNAVSSLANATLGLVGLDIYPKSIIDSKGDPVAIDRVAQRMEIWGVALDALNDFEVDTANVQVANSIVKIAVASGFFSIWMAAFDNYPRFKLQLIRAFKGTETSGCFDLVTGDSVIPAPNPDRLIDGGKF